MTATPCRARDRATQRILAERLRLAHTHWTRLKGLLGTRSLPEGDGLWLKPCSRVHMIGMRYPIDVVFLDEENRVLRTVSALQPGKISPRVPGAVSAIELPAGTVARLGLAAGALVGIEGDVSACTNDRLAAVGAAMCNILLALLFALFAAIHVTVAMKTRQWATAMPLVVQEALLVVLFLGRRRSVATSTRPFDWLVGILGTFLPLLLRPTDPSGPLSSVGSAAQITGLMLAIVALTTLGRSVGVVAANRGIKTGGLYGIVRHPVYAAHMLSCLGYTTAYPSARNCLITALTVLALNARAVVEERLLGGDPSYRAYLERVRWRFVPYAY